MLSWFRQGVEQGTVAGDPITWFERRHYTIRQPIRTALAELLQLEDEWWIEPLRASTAELQPRIERYPAGQCVVAMADEVIGVIILGALSIRQRSSRQTCTRWLQWTRLMRPLLNRW